MNRNLAIALAATAAFAGTAYAQAPTQPGTSTPGTVNPQASDPGTATPSTVSPGGTTEPQTASPDAASSPHQRQTLRSNAQEASPTTGDPANGANQNDASTPHQRQITGLDRAAPQDADGGGASDRTRLASASGLSAGMAVRSKAGEPVGTVKDVVPDPATGGPGYVIIGTRTGSTVAVPYPAVKAMTTQDGRIVMDTARLEKAPKVSGTQLQDTSDTQWRKQSDRFWNSNGGLRR